MNLQFHFHKYKQQIQKIEFLPFFKSRRSYFIYNASPSKCNFYPYHRKDSNGYKRNTEIGDEKTPRSNDDFPFLQTFCLNFYSPTFFFFKIYLCFVRKSVLQREATKSFHPLGHSLHPFGPLSFERKGEIFLTALKIKHSP